MTVNNLITETLVLMGMSQAADEGEDPSAADTARMRGILLLCFNAVADELARGYFPLKTVQTLTSDTGSYMFADFPLVPYRIISVKSGGEKVAWKLRPLCIECDRPSIDVEYEYVPQRKESDDEFSYPDTAVSELLVEYGMAAEYMLICGDAEASAAWESRYRAEIDRQLSARPVRGRVPPRRWL